MDIISAIATASGVGGVAIIRLSGADSLKIAQKMFTPVGKTSVNDFKPNVMYAGNIDGNGFTDFGMCVYFKAPKSFTGEDTVEFHCHGGVQISRGILKRTLELGARLADRGEFTKRAFVNGKLSLSSAEGMIDMINAESLAALRAGSMLYGEKLTEEIKVIQSELTDILAQIAVDIDYPEEENEDSFENICSKISSLSERLNTLASTYAVGKRIKDGVTVALCGKPNTGKSSILNALLGYDKAIVSSEEGTTRDAVEGEMQIDGVKYNLIDTAGIRSRAGEVESIGIERAKKIISSADIILSVSDGGGKAEIGNCNGAVIEVFNKCDVNSPKEKYDVKISAKTGEGIDKLKKIIAEKAIGETSLEKAYIIEERHFSALQRANAALKSAIANADGLSLDMLSVDLKEAWDSLGEITGETANEQIISTVFAKFCVGK
ncbi:MAG: tRNA uridine-5-carboxymethylaminomethyl(34) synthesis GTPase MnmE [Clostridia bacterium]|nr:tRNA uridine-5-carboxymethylaminomethyl(34) synthesis GTPase MnmE [Clostridia bacterium]